MSNLIFPRLRGVGWDTKLAPQWETGRSPAKSGREVTIQYRSQPRTKITLQYEFLRDADPVMSDDGSPVYADFDTMLGFFNRHGGAAQSFLFQGVNAIDLAKYSVVGEHIGAGDGTTTDFQLLRDVGGWQEFIYWPIGYPTLYLDGVETSLRQNYLARSDDFGVSPWILGGSGSPPVVTSNAGGVPGGFSGASDRVQFVATPAPSDYCDVLQRVDFGSPVAGRTFTFDVWLYANGGAQSLQMYICGPTPPFAGTFTTQSVPSTTWTEYSITLTVPDDVTGTVLQVAIRNPGSSGIKDFNIFAAQVNEGPTALPYQVTAASTFHPLNGSGVLHLPTAPADGVEVSVDFGFAYRCRFDEDAIEFSNFSSYFWDCQTVPLITVKP